MPNVTKIGGVPVSELRDKLKVKKPKFVIEVWIAGHVFTKAYANDAELEAKACFKRVRKSLASKYDVQVWLGNNSLIPLHHEWAAQLDADESANG